ncbi:MAG: hypothetical protein PVG79_10660 [Gemmatimonadales bacterium]
MLDLPERAGAAPGGDEISREIRTLELRAREERIHAEISQGNVPTWLRQLRPVEVRGEVDGRRHRITFWVTPDYLAVGSDDDYLLIPLTAQTAQRVADLVGGSLPTPRMVDAIWASADLRLDPIRLQPDESMKTVRYFARHDNLVKGQRHLYDAPLGVLVAGHKLDVVITSTLAERPGEIALYGWHRSSGQVIQPLFIGATDSLVTFSHGVRLVDRNVVVDGARRDLWDVLRDPELAPILSDDGVIAQARYPAPGVTEAQ